jgi:beta-glucosidase-like glycosyl hydrolase
MKALAADRPVPQSAVDAIAAGCDGVLVCSGDHDTQARALEDLVRAAESDRLFMRRVEDALARHRRAKERFLATAVSAAPLSSAALRQALGRDDHRRIADEMARFV